MESLSISLGFMALGFFIAWFIAGWYCRRSQEQTLEMVREARAQAAAYRKLFYAAREGQDGNAS